MNLNSKPRELNKYVHLSRAIQIFLSPAKILHVPSSGPLLELRHAKHSRDEGSTPHDELIQSVIESWACSLRGDDILPNPASTATKKYNPRLLRQKSFLSLYFVPHAQDTGWNPSGNAAVGYISCYHGARTDN